MDCRCRVGLAAQLGRKERPVYVAIDTVGNESASVLSWTLQMSGEAVFRQLVPLLNEPRA
jgi:hypothetical protein